MPRDTSAYLADIVESCEAIEAALIGFDLQRYTESRLVRSSVEREFIIVGEAITALSHKSPHAFAAITKARRIVDFRNRLTHEYSTVDDEFVWAIAKHDVPVLRDECRALLEREPAIGED
jgi:uncharacterized protein with HEPN domain